MQKLKFLLGLAVAVVALAGCSHPTDTSQGRASPASPTAPIPVVSAPPAAVPTPSPEAAPRQAEIYTVDLTHGSDANHYLVKRTIALTSAKDPAREAITALIDAPGSPIPSGTRLLSVKISDGLATLDFSQSPVDETRGEDQQSQALEAIQRTLGQFPNISRIQILINGQPAASLGQAAGGPMDVLRPGENPGDTGGA